MSEAPSPPKPSGTVVAVRDGGVGLEVLLLERAPRGDADGPRPWVFPGGKVDPADHGPDEEPVVERARRAAVREAGEEAGLALRTETLVTISRWVTPPVTPKRFDTWFFLTGVAADASVRVDGQEIARHRWLRPDDALAAHREREIRLAPPTFVTVTWLVEHGDVRTAAAALGEAPLITFHPRIHTTAEGACILYPGDAGYEDGRLEHDGPTHRLWARGRDYRYEISPELRLTGPRAG